jgi:hypothetical protein
LIKRLKSGWRSRRQPPAPSQETIVATLQAELAQSRQPPGYDRLKALQDELSRFPQRDCPLAHHFADGLYGRVLTLPADTIAIGKLHATEHLFMLLAGEMTIVTDEGPKRIQGPIVTVSPPGTKRAVYAHTECVTMNVHHNPGNTTDLDRIEAHCITPEAPALNTGE